MAIITTYICDVSGMQGAATDFVEINITPSKVSYHSNFHTTPSVKKIIHKSVAEKFKFLLPQKGTEETPEPTLESKLIALLKDYVSEIAYEAGSEGAADAMSHRG